jgi:ubiquinone biosynthesis protein COQ4
VTTFDRPLDFRTAFRALSALFANPDDTKQAFRVAQALTGATGERMYQRFQATDVGRDVLAEHRALLTALKDTRALEALPANTLGRAYLEFLRSQQITAEGLVAASEEGYALAEDLDDDRRLFSDRLRDMHDLWHVVAGYRGDLIGEGAVLALSFAQTRNLGVGLIAILGILKIGTVAPGARALIAKGFARGVRAAWLPAVDWESMLARPLDDVRRELGFDAPPTYAPLYTSDPRVAAAIAA